MIEVLAVCDPASKNETDPQQTYRVSRFSKKARRPGENQSQDGETYKSVENQSELQIRGHEHTVRDRARNVKLRT